MVRLSSEQRVSSRSPFAFFAPQAMGTHDSRSCSRVPAGACIEVVHQEHLVISWHRVECVSEDVVDLLLILL